LHSGTTSSGAKGQQGKVADHLLIGLIEED
jgi:hypothetical protein